VQAGKLSALGVSTLKRSALLPDIPPIAESGLPGYTMSTWWGVIAPAGVPAAIVEKLNREIGDIVTSAESKTRLESNGAEAAKLSSAEFGRLLTSEVEKWRRVAQESNIKAQ
jgi:tripartite-type tricarboxylate transporter receptor subunit TctC